MNFFQKDKINLLYFFAFTILVLGAYFVNANVSLRTTREISESVFWLSIPGLAFSLLCLFLNQRVFRSWSKFTLTYLSLAILIILTSPNSTHGMDIYGRTKGNATILLASLYTVISFSLIIYKSFKKEVV